MHEIMKLKEMLLKELEEYGSKGELTSGTLEVVDKLAHAVKNLCKVIEAYEEEEEYSGRNSYRDGGSFRYSRQGGGSSGRGGSYRDGGSSSRYDGGSYARGRGQNAPRDTMGRYSRGGSPDEMIEQLETLMQDAPSEQIRQGIQKLVQQVEQMM